MEALVNKFFPNKIMPFAASWIDLEIIILSEISQTKNNIIQHHLYVESLKMMQMNTTERDSQTKKTSSLLPKGKGGEG